MTSISRSKFLSVPAQVKSEVAEELLTEVERGEAERILRLPNQVKTTSLYAFPALIQAVLTWGKRSRTRVLSTYLTADPARDMEILERNEVLLVACWHATKVINQRGDDITFDVRKILRAVTRNKQDIPQKRSSQAVRPSASVIILDGDSEFGHPESLYRALGTDAHEAYLIDELTKPKYFMDMPEGERADLFMKRRLPLGVKACQLTNMPVGTLGARINHLAKPLGRILFELVQNTHVHATKDVTGNLIWGSIRMVHVKAIEGFRSKLTESESADRSSGEFFSQLPASNYVRKDGSEMPADALKDDYIRAIAVSVIDSGPGFGPKEAWSSGRRNDHLDLDDEVSFALSALRKVGTTVERPLRGRGLRDVQRLLTEYGGYCTIRSGRFSATRNFRTHPFSDTASDPSLWTVQELGYREDARSVDVSPVGTAVTVVVPIQRHWLGM